MADDVDYGAATFEPYESLAPAVPGLRRFGAGAGLDGGAEPETSGPGLGAIAAAAFRQDNTIVSAIDVMRESAGVDFRPEAGHDPLSIVTGTPYEDHLDAFVGSESEAETRFIMRRIDRELADRKVLAEGGVLGLVAQMGAGVIDPTILLPGGAIIRGAKGARIGATMLASGALTGAGVAVQEGVLQSTQQIRPGLESAVAIAGATVIGGVLGGAVAGLSRREIAAMGKKVDDVMRGADGADDETMPTPEAAGAAPVQRGSSAPVSTMGVDKAVGWISPVTRLQTGPFEAGRLAARDLAEAAIDTEATRAGFAQSPGGSVETRVKTWYGPLANAIEETDRAFAEYWLGKPAGAVGRMMLSARSEWARLTGSAGGRLTAREFREEVGRAMRRADDHPIPQVAAAARAYRALVFDPLRDRAIDLGLLPPDVKATTALSYLTRVYEVDKIIAERPTFKGRLVDYFERGQRSARRRIADLEMKRDFEAKRVDELRQGLNEEVARTVAERARLAAVRESLKPQVKEARETVKGAEKAAATGERKQSAAERRKWASLLKDIQRGRGDVKPKDIVSFVREQGGIRAVRLDALGRKGRYQDRGSELTRMMQGLGKKGLINNREGLGADDMARRAVDEGFLDVGAGPDELLEAIERTIRGEPVHSMFDVDAAVYARQMKELREEIEAAGRDVRSMTPEELAEAMNDGAKVRAPEVARLLRDVEEALKDFDPKAARLDEVERLIAQLDEASDELKAKAKDVRDVTREKAREMRALEREIASEGDFERLTPEEVGDLVEEVIDTIIGNGRVLPGLDVVAGRKGALKARTLKIADDEIEDFLVNDAEQVAKVYTKTMAGQVELVDKFGSLDLMDVVVKIDDEANALIEKARTPAERKAINDQRSAAVRDVEALRDRVRHSYAVPDEPNGLAERAGRTLLAFNMVRLLGGQTVSSLGDVAYPVMRHGLLRVFRDGWVPFATGIAGLSPAMKTASRELKLAGSGAIDMVLDQRFSELADLAEDWGRRTKFEKLTDAAGARFGMVSLIAPWTATMKTIAGMPAMNRLLEIAEKSARGTASGVDTARLASLGIDRFMADRIAAQFRSPGGGDVVSGLRLPNTEAWTDRGAKEAFRAAIVKDVDMAIVTPGLERPLMLSKTWAKVILQFKSFAIASTQRILLSGLAQRDAAFLNGLLVAVAAGSLAAQSKAWLRGDDPGEWSAVKHVTEAVDYSGVLAVLMEAHNTIDKTTGVGLSRLTGKQMSRYQSRGAFSSLFGPTVGLGEDTVQVARGVTSGEFGRSDLHKARQLLPLQNLFYLRHAIDQVEEGVGNAMGLPPRKPAGSR